MNKKHGFTLAEVLITLVIIGVIAAMTVPTLMQSTGSEEYKTAFKKSVAMLNQAITMNYALLGADLSTVSGTQDLVDNFSSRLSVLKSDTTSIYTADGMKFTFPGTVCPASATTCSEYVVVDVNGDKGPNTVTMTANDVKDIFSVSLYANRAVPNEVGSQIMYNMQTTPATP